MNLNMQKIALALCILLTVLTIGVSSASPLESLVRRNKPFEHTMEEFEKTCEMCGQFFGYDTTYDCMTDPSNKVFKLCLKAVGKR